MQINKLSWNINKTVFYSGGIEMATETIIW